VTPKEIAIDTVYPQKLEKYLRGAVYLEIRLRGEFALPVLE
jgi:hypothetical protein